MKKCFAFIVLLLLFFNYAQCQNPNYFTAQKTRDSISQALKTSIHQTIELPFTERYFPKYKGSFWAMQLMLYKPANYYKQLPQQISKLATTPAYFQYSFLEMLYTLYPKQYAKNLVAIWQHLSTPKIKSLALEYLAQASIFPKVADTSIFYKSPHYSCYKERWIKPKPLQLPTKNACLQNNFLPNEDVVISFQHKDRNKPGYVLFRTKNHTWLKDKNGKIAKYTQLARSISNLPYYLTNGNTPQGLYKIAGIDTSDNAWIGQTPNLQIRLPFEDDLAPFFSSDTNYVNSYSNILGSLKKYPQLQQSFMAGKLGRSEIIAHGTTINPAFYKNKPYYPCTPSLGCLCSPEIYNHQGKRVKSEQVHFINTILQQKIKPTWLLVVEVSDL